MSVSLDFHVVFALVPSELRDDLQPTSILHAVGSRTRIFMKGTISEEWTHFIEMKFFKFVNNRKFHQKLKFVKNRKICQKSKNSCSFFNKFFDFLIFQNFPI